MALDDILQGLENQKKRIESNLSKLQDKPATTNPGVIPTYEPTPKVKAEGKIESETEEQIGLQPGQKVDIGKALKLRINNHLSYQEIADKFGCSKTYIYKVLHEFEELIKNPEAAQAYHENKAGILSAVELRLAKELVNEDLLKAASLNNVAYAFQQIHNAGRLERGASTQNISIAGRFMMLQGEAEDDGVGK